MRASGEETAQEMRAPIIWVKAREAAALYSFLKIKCPGCRAPILGSEFAKHVAVEHSEVIK